MISDRITVCTDGQGLEDALREADKVAAYKGLNHRQTLQLRLLAEEMTGMLRGVAGSIQARFWIDDENGAYRLHLWADADLNAQLRDDLLSLSTSGRNAAARGIMGKIRDLFTRAFEPMNDGTPTDAFAMGWLEEEIGDSSAGAAAQRLWSLSEYRSNAAREKTGAAWDELEKSIIANAADEVLVALRDQQVELTVTKAL